MIAHARDARIDMLRGVSILLVLLHHFNIPYSLKDTGLAALLGWPFLRARAQRQLWCDDVLRGVGFPDHAQRAGPLGRAGPHPAWGVLHPAGGAHPALPAAGLADGRCAGPGRRADLRQPGGRGRVAVDGQCRRADGLGERADRSAWLDQLSAGRAVVAVCRDGVLPVIPAGLPGAAQGLGAGRAGGWARRGAAVPPGQPGRGRGVSVWLCGLLRRHRHGLLRCRAGAARPVRRPGRPAVRAIIGAAMAGLYLAWPIGQSNVLGTTAMAFGTALLLLGGATASGRMPGPCARWPPVVGSATRSTSSTWWCWA